jgi:hypothetical protein
MTTYATTDSDPTYLVDESTDLRVTRTTNLGTLAFAVVSITGGGTGTVDSGPGTTDPSGSASQRFSVWIA